MKFVLFVEGHTERSAIPSFLKRWLDPKLNQSVGIQPVRFEGWSQFQQKVARSARMHLEGVEEQQIVGAIGLLDLYGPTFFPDRLSTLRERYGWAITHFQAEVDHPKFRMFFAVHEIEAWILSQPQLFPPAIARAIAQFARPETINFNEPPAKLLERLYRSHTGREYKKIVYGKGLFDRLDPSVAYDKCPYLANMLDEMLRMARQSGL